MSERFLFFALFTAHVDMLSRQSTEETASVVHDATQAYEEKKTQILDRISVGIFATEGIFAKLNF